MHGDSTVIVLPQVLGGCFAITSVTFSSNSAALNGEGAYSDLFGMRIRQRVEQNAVDDGKKRCVRTDPEHESENGDRGEARRFKEHAKGVKQILR